ncbi:MAG: hypothetical protein AB1489_39900 [Acidobacteriota bacterium]
MNDNDKEKASQDLFEEMRRNIEIIAVQTIKDCLSPLQTKKLSKKMIEQVASSCAAQIANEAAVYSRKTSSQHAIQVTSTFSDLLTGQPVTKPVFNDKLTAAAGTLSSEDLAKINRDREIASRVVSRVYQSIFDFALELGLKAFEPTSSTQPQAVEPVQVPSKD